jgi:hypothetical protein
MSILLPLLLLVAAILLVAFLGFSGLWSNLIMFVNVVLATLLAMNFWEPLAGTLTGMLPSLANYADLLAIWGLFAGSLLVMRVVTDKVSRVKVLFPKTVELAANYAVIVLTVSVLIGFTTMTLHMAPLAREYFQGGFNAEKPVLFGYSPDRLWLGFMQRASQGALGRSGTESNPEAHVFDPDGTFMLRYAARRELYERSATAAAGS